MTLWSKEEGMLRTFVDSTGNQQMGLSARGEPLACQLSSHFPRGQGIRNGRPRTTSTRSCTKAAKCKKSGENKKAKAPWSAKEAKDEGIDFYDVGSVQQIQTYGRTAASLGNHLRSPTAALADALKRTEEKMWAVPVISSEWCVMCLDDASKVRGVWLVSRIVRHVRAAHARNSFF